MKPNEQSYSKSRRLLASDLTMKLLVQPLVNSLIIGAGVSICAIALGSVLAWLMVRSDLPFKPFFSLAVIIPYMIPSWVKSQAWLSMFKTPRVGGAPGFVASIMLNMGMSPDAIETVLGPIAYGEIAVIIVLSLHYYAYTAVNTLYIVEGTPHPSAAKLLIRFLMGGVDGDTSGYKPFNTLGGWPVRDDIEPAEGSTPFAEINVAPFDANEIYYNYNTVRDFWQQLG